MRSGAEEPLKSPAVRDDDEPMTQTMTETGTVDIHSEAFARRLANLLAERRRQRGTTLRKLARTSRRALSSPAQELQGVRGGFTATIDAERLDAVVELYGADIDLIMAARLPLEVRPMGVLVTGGIAQSFTPGDETSLLMTYLKLVRQLRSAERAPSIELRREDVEVLAEHLHVLGESIVDRLGALMGATVAQRRAMAGLFVSGALVIGLAGGSVAALGGGNGGGGGSDTTVPAHEAVTTTIVTVDPASVIAERAGDVVDGAHALPSIVLDGDSHARGPSPFEVGADEVVTSDVVVEDSGAPTVDVVDSVPEASPAPPADDSAPFSPVVVAEDTATSEDGSIGVASPVVAPVVDEQLPGGAVVIDDATVPEVVDEDVPFADDPSDDVGTVDVGTPPVPVGDQAEQAVAPPPLP